MLKRKQSILTPHYIQHITMKENNQKIDSLTDKLLNNESNHHSDDELFSIIDKITVSPEITSIGEELREPIFLELESRINATSRRSLWIKVAGIAASVIILLGVTNYISYTEGYKDLNALYVETKTPLAIQSSITLSDGTIVILNAGTRLVYPTTFTSKTREVTIEGEAFFEVAKDSEHPFIVNTGDLRVCVLGTKFNVKAYENENQVDVTLEEGSVEVGLNSLQKQHQLVPGEQIRFDKSTEKFTKRQVNLSYYTSWKEGKFFFNKESFDDISKQLERHFNVDIHIASEKLKHIVYTGDFVRNENLEQILRIMTADKRSKYTIEGNQVLIYE